MMQLRADGCSLAASRRPIAPSCIARTSNWALAVGRPCRHGHGRIPVRAIPDGDAPGSGDEKPDIDQLARFLSQRASELRASMGDTVDFGEEEQELLVGMSAGTVQAPFGPMSAELEMRVFQEIGDGGFVPDDFEILQRLGRISIQESGRPGASPEPRTAVIAYAARYIPRIPYSRNVTTMLKEYLPVAKPVAFNELLLLQHLCGIPDNKYQAADSRPTRTPPVVPLLGYFASAPSEDAEEALVSQGPASAAEREQDSVWLVYKWEGLRPLGLYLEIGPPKASGGLFKSQQMAEAEAWANRRAMLRTIASQLLSALDFVHSADCVHGSLSTGTVLLNTSEDLGDPEYDVLLKLDSFGFGKWFAAASLATPAPYTTSMASASGSGPYGPVALGPALEAGKKADLQAAALVLFETFSAGLAMHKGGAMTRPALQRLLFGVFAEDIAGFRNYCMDDPEESYTSMVAFLDDQEGAGWDFLGKLLQGQTSALELSQHPFLKAKEKAKK